MASPPDWLEGLGGALLGVNKGLTLAADPYRVWENVNQQTLANAKAGIENRDLGATQAAREQFPDFYGNKIASTDAVSRALLTKSNLDAYGQENTLALQQDLANPNGVFQGKMRAMGWTPDMPEYQRAAQEIIGTYNPQLGIAAGTAFKTDDVEQRNLQKQSALAFAQAYARTEDPGATAEFAPDGTITVTGSDGRVVKNLNPDTVLRVASMMAAKDPASPILAAIKTQTDVQEGNAKLIAQLRQGSVSPAQQAQALTQLRLMYAQEYSKALAQEMALPKDFDYQSADPDVKKEKMDRARAIANDAHKRMRDLDKQLQNLSQGIRPGMEGGAGAALPPMPVEGAPSLNALPFGPRGAAAGQAAGGGRVASAANVLDAFGQFGQSAGPRAPASQSDLQPFINQLLQPGR